MTATDQGIAANEVAIPQDVETFHTSNNSKENSSFGELEIMLNLWNKNGEVILEDKLPKPTASRSR